MRTAALSAALFLVASCLLPLSLFAQTPDTLRVPTGFSDPARTQPIDAYRLPDWHFSTLALDGSALGARNTSSFDGNDRTSTNLRANLVPRYEALWESEARVLRLDVASPFRYRYRDLDTEFRTSPDGDPSEGRDEASLTSVDFDVRVAYDAYFSGDTFLRAEESFSLSYDRRSSESTGSGDLGRSDADIDEAQTRIFSDTRIGIGFGRVRNVTPVIRALRVDERLRALGREGLSAEEVQVAARQLARFPGYNAVYDRPDKYFWGTFFDGVGGSGLSSLASFYVADVLQEPVGRRRNGSEIVAGPTLRLIHENNDFDGNRFQPDFTETDALLGGFASARWFDNPSLRHQFGAEFDAAYRFLLGDAELVRSGLDRQWSLQPSVSWLWLVADRLQLDTRLFADVIGEHVDRPAFAPISGDGEETLIQQRYGLDTNLTVFIENRLALSGGASVAHFRSEQIGDDQLTLWDLQFRIDFRYFLFRSLR